jgi:hypothetical protein
MKKIILLGALATICFVVNAQKTNTNTAKFKFSAGADFALPFGLFSNFYSVGFGASAQADYLINQKSSVGLNVGYMNYVGKTVLRFRVPNIDLIPVLAGLKHEFTEELYGQFQLGVTFFSNDAGSAFTYAPGIGCKFNSHLDGLLKLQGWSNDGSSTQQLALRVAYTF